MGTCRDEVCFPFVAQLEAVWGPAFQLGSLGGLLTIGRTGIAAVASHAPLEPGEPVRYVLVAAAHIGVDDAGTFGYLRREHQEVSSRTCGALMAFRDELLTSRLRLGYDPVDPEMSLLRERILTALVYGDIPEPVELTQVVARVIDEDLRDLLALDPGRRGARAGGPDRRGHGRADPHRSRRLVPGAQPADPQHPDRRAGAGTLIAGASVGRIAPGGPPRAQGRVIPIGAPRAAAQSRTCSRR